MDCVKCYSRTQKFGKIKRSQRYQCLNCGSTFTEESVRKQKERGVRYQLIKDMYTLSGMSTTEIGESLGVSSTVPQRILKKMGVTRNISEAKKGKLRGTSLPVEEIIEMYTDGIPSTKIAEDLGYAKSSILRVLEQNGVTRDNEYDYSHPKDDEILGLYSEGLSMLTVSKILTIPYSTINNRLHNYGVVRTEDRFKIGMDYDLYLAALPTYLKYRSDVNKITCKQPIYRLVNYDKRGLCGVEGAYQLDHKFSILEGFKQGIEPEIIGNINNLEFIPWKENLTKGINCSISLEELKIKTN